MPNSGLDFLAGSLAIFEKSSSCPVQITGSRMNANEKAYRRLIRHSFCHWSDNEMDEYIHRARWRARLVVAFLAALVLAYVCVVRPT